MTWEKTALGRQTTLAMQTIQMIFPTLFGVPACLIDRGDRNMLFIPFFLLNPKKHKR